MDGTTNTPEPDPERNDEPEIILLAIEKKKYYMYKGDDHLNQLLLSDGVYPKPVLCVSFDSLFDARRIIGDGFSVSSCWAIHPEIIERLRTEKCLIETDA